MVRPAVLAAALLAAYGCSRAEPPSSPSNDDAEVRTLLDQLNRMTDEGGHGLHHRADNELQQRLWKRLGALPPGPAADAARLDAAERVYTRYDENYFHGILWHWPYLSSPKAIDLCDRIVQSTRDPETRERALWIKAFALRCPPTERWEKAESELETYAEQARWKPDLEASREVYRTIANEFPTTPRGKASARLLNRPDLSLVLPKGPREKDPRNPDN
jgi:hypothetical protein